MTWLSYSRFTKKPIDPHSEKHFHSQLYRRYMLPPWIQATNIPRLSQWEFVRLIFEVDTVVLLLFCCFEFEAHRRSPSGLRDVGRDAINILGFRLHLSALD